MGILKDGWVEVDLPELGWLVQVRVVHAEGRPHLVGLRLEPRDEALIADVAVTSERLRALPLRQIREAAFAATYLELGEVAKALAKVERVGRQPWPDEHYAQVAEVYRRAVDSGKAPLTVISRHWNVSRPMAAKYVRRARELGLLGYPERPGVAGAGRPTSPIGGAPTPAPPPRRSKPVSRKKTD